MTGPPPALGFHREAIHTFAGGDLDRSAHLRKDDRRITTMHESASSRYLPFRALEPLIEGNSEPALSWLPRAEVDDIADVRTEALFLGLRDGAARFAVRVPAAIGKGDLGPDGAAFQDAREVAPLLAAADASIVAMGRSLVGWHDKHRHCPRCGSPADGAEAGHARRCTNGNCGATQFPRTDPVVIMLVYRGESCLLARAVRSRRYPAGLHSCLAGYMESGESIEEAVRRETWEEAGIRVGRVRYHSSQPWPFPSTLMIGCFAEALPGTPRIDPDELESVRWFTREELRQGVERWEVEDALRLPPPLTIAHQLARAWLEEDSVPG